MYNAMIHHGASEEVVLWSLTGRGGEQMEMSSLHDILPEQLPRQCLAISLQGGQHSFMAYHAALRERLLAAGSSTCHLYLVVEPAPATKEDMIPVGAGESVAARITWFVASGDEHAARCLARWYGPTVRLVFHGWPPERLPILSVNHCTIVSYLDEGQESRGCTLWGALLSHFVPSGDLHLWPCRSTDWSRVEDKNPFPTPGWTIHYHPDPWHKAWATTPDWRQRLMMHPLPPKRRPRHIRRERSGAE